MSTYELIINKLKNHALLGILMDPEHDTPEKLAQLAESSVNDGVDIIFIGGSSNIDPSIFLTSIEKFKESIQNRVPIIIYTEDFNMVTKNADGILYGSVFNSNDPHYLIRMQVSTAPLMKKVGIEVLNTAFIIFEPGGTVGHVMNCNPIPRTNKKIGLAYTMAAELMGYRFVYLEAGSRVGEPLEDDLIKLHRKNLKIPIIVGGGIKTTDKAKSLVESGASIIIIGTAFEKGAQVSKFVDAIHSAKHLIPDVAK